MGRVFSLMIAAGLALVTPYPSLAAGPSLAARPAVAPLLLQIDAGGAPLANLVDLDYDRNEGHVTASGRVEKSWGRGAHSSDYVDVQLLDDQGRVIMQRQASLFGYGPSTRSPDYARFAARFDAVPADTRALRFRYHVGVGAPDRLND